MTETLGNGTANKGLFNATYRTCITLTEGEIERIM